MQQGAVCFQSQIVGIQLELDLKKACFYNITSLFNLRNNHIFTNALDNLCQNALDLINGKLIIEGNLPTGTFCQWVISAPDDKHYVNLEFEKLDVRTTEL